RPRDARVDEIALPRPAVGTPAGRNERAGWSVGKAPSGRLFRTMQRSELSSAQIAYLDLVRAAGALMVLFGHAAHYFWPQSWLGNLLMFQYYPVFQILRRLGLPDAPWMIAPFGSARPFWTISIEWWIYMLFGGVMFFCVRRRGRVAGLTVLALALVAIEPAYH